MPVQPYPWDFLEKVSRKAVRTARVLRARLEPAVRLERLGETLGAVLSSTVHVVVRRVTPADQGPAADRAVHLVTADGAVSVALEPEPALATLLLARMLERAAPPTRPDAPLDAATRGALAAVALEAARRSGAEEPIRASVDGPAGGPCLRVDATVIVDDQSYGVTAFARELRPTNAVPRSLAAFVFPIRLTLVAAISTAPARDARALAVGDVWLPGAGWLGDRFALAAPNGERGVEVARSEGGGIVIRSAVVALGADSDASGEPRRSDAMAEPEDTLTEIAAEAPVVVRVEIGSVTLPASAWSELRPGDVLETGVRLAEPVVLRIAGQEVARGELVDVDGEVGVRIRELVAPGHLPGTSPR